MREERKTEWKDILDGVGLFVRDTDLPKHCAEKYQVGTVLMERGFTDASVHVGGMATTHRFAVLSNHMRDFRSFEQGTNWGLFVAKNNAHFRVLDVYESTGKTQILLLHLPDDPSWKAFTAPNSAVEERLIAEARKRFEKALTEPPIPALHTEDWKRRCAAPLGMDEEGNLFDLQPILENELLAADQVNFRSFYHRTVYLHGAQLLNCFSTEEIRPGDTGVVAYGYIDETQGLSFRALYYASLKGAELQLRKIEGNGVVLFRFGALKGLRYFDMAITEHDLSEWDPIIREIRETYDTKNPEKEEIRSKTMFDLFRHPEYPDDFAVFLVRQGFESELVWVRANQWRDQQLSGELLNEPKKNFGVHRGDQISIQPYRQKDGSTMCVCVLG